MSDRTGPPPASARRRRADAERNISAILDAALTCLASDADASVADIAQAAGVGRMTLYGHFSTRAELIDAVLARTVATADATLAAVDLDSLRPDEALAQLVSSSWRILQQYRALHAAAQRELDARRIRMHHDKALGRVRQLLDRGQRDGVFRTDLPAPWLVALFYSVLHTAADEISAGRLGAADAADVITKTLLGAFR
jgi:TetR/AcrR family transcriptional regulator, mexCD-oprJ operon repressor